MKYTLLNVDGHEFKIAHMDSTLYDDEDIISLIFISRHPNKFSSCCIDEYEINTGTHNDAYKDDKDAKETIIYELNNFLPLYRKALCKYRKLVCLE